MSPAAGIQRQLNSALFERSVLSPPKLSTGLAELNSGAMEGFDLNFSIPTVTKP
jgi:hypothetical protein